ncbi:MAG TPA: hypothetical protein VKJ01_13980 [Candidatus Solibacter sp.]|nr:hypothetical protein [Candidatus Solibacter sp.]
MTGGRQWFATQVGQAVPPAIALPANINGVHVVMAIQPLHGKSYAFAAVVWNEILTAAANPVTVKLAIGDDTGSRAVSAFFATVHHDN